MSLYRDLLFRRPNMYIAAYVLRDEVSAVQTVVYAWGRCSVGRVGHGPPKILVGWATMHLAPPILACTFLNSTSKSIRLTMQPVRK